MAVRAACAAEWRNWKLEPGANLRREVEEEWGEGNGMAVGEVRGYGDGLL